MKYIIDAYRKDQVKWGKLAAYAKSLEAEVQRLRNVLIANGIEDAGHPEDAAPAKVIKELKAQLAEQESKMQTLNRNLCDSEITRLRNLIEKEYPLRIARIRWFKGMINSQKCYIRILQRLLDDNDIFYSPYENYRELEAQAVENHVNDKAVRVPDDLDQKPKLPNEPDENEKKL